MAKIIEIPKKPANWAGEMFNFWNTLAEDLETLASPVSMSDLDKALQRRINESSSSREKDYSEEIQDTGIKWIDGSPIKRITYSASVQAGTDYESDEITDFGTIIKAEGFVSNNGAIYMLGQDVRVWKTGGKKFKINSTYSGEASITLYFIPYTEPPAPVGDSILFDHGYIDGIEWTGNTFTRPQYTNYAHYTLDYVLSDGYMRIYNSPTSNYNHNAHVTTVTPITVPADASTMNVSVSGALNVQKMDMSFGLLPGTAPNSYDTSNGGQLSTSATVDENTETTYTLTLNDSVKGQQLYPIINGRGIATVTRFLHVYKVWFE